VLHPINRLTRAERRAEWRNWQPNLAERIARYRPQAVVSLLKIMTATVAAALKNSNVDAKLYSVPFPGMDHLARFRAAMAEILPKLPRKGL
jgi:hypothetical protein